MDTFLMFSIMVLVFRTSFQFLMIVIRQIAIFGYFEGTKRRIENVRETTEFLIYLDKKSPLGIELQKAFGKSWEECCKKWNAIIEELWTCDLICEEDKEKLLVSKFEASISNVKVSLFTAEDSTPRISTYNTATELRHRMPIDISALGSAARERISFFIR